MYYAKLTFKRQATPYLPNAKDANGNPHVTFNIGLHDKQTKLDFKFLDSHPLGESYPNYVRIKLMVLARFNPTKSGFIFSAGGPIWGMDWCPFPDDKADSKSSSKSHKGIADV